MEDLTFFSSAAAAIIRKKCVRIKKNWNNINNILYGWNVDQNINNNNEERPYKPSITGV